MDTYDSILCKECNEYFGQLNYHLKKKHSMTCNEYLKKYPGSALTSQKIIDAIKLDKKKTKEKRSQQAKEDFRDGKRKIPERAGRGIGGRRPDIHNKYFRSTWEANLARILELKEIQYEYENEKMKMPILNEDGSLKYSYLVDFYLPKYDAYIEVKGKWEDIAKEKVDLFKQQYDNKLIVLEGKQYEKLRKKFEHKINLWENPRKNIRKMPELYQEFLDKDLINQKLEECPVCGSHFKNLTCHLGHPNDDKHKTFYENQMTIIRNLFYDYNVNGYTNLRDHGLYFTYKRCIRLWHEEFSKEERKKRADKLTSLGNIKTKNRKKDINSDLI